MKTLLALFAILTSFAASAQSIEINANGGTANASAILDLKSTTKGFLLPRMTNAQMRAIPNPAQGLLAFCTDCGINGDYYFYKGTAWVTLGSTTVGTIASATPNGASITNGVLSLAPADATNPGIVTTTAQTIAGAKTFSSDINVNGITVGKGAGSGFYNTANGYQALNSNTTGIVNTANGYQALRLNTTGNANTANGSEALVSNISGNNNTANGSQALFTNITGNNNTANGFETLKLNTTGNANTATGLLALSTNTTGNQNTANGQQALVSNTTGSKNTAIGYLTDVASGDLTNATAIGNGAVVNASNKIQLGNGSVTAVQLGTGTNVTLETGLVKITGGTPGAGKVLTSDAAGLASWISPSSSGVGVDLTTAQTIAGVKTFSNGIVGNVTGNVTGNASTATTATNVSGVVAIANGGTGSSTQNFVDLTTAQTIAGAKTFSADLTVNGLTVGKGTAGIATNTAIGISALASNTTGYQNTATGFQALYSNNSSSTITFNRPWGSNNTATGFQTLFNNTAGYENTATGHQALYSNTTGYYNVANGYRALYSNNSSTTIIGFTPYGSYNTATGYRALFNNTTGYGNIAAGYEALYSNTIGLLNTAIGRNADVASGDLINATAIGANAIVNASDKIQLGDGNVTVVQLGTGTNVTLETGLVKITGGTPGEGKVLTSDAAGLASWTSPSSSGGGVDLTTDQTIAGAKTFASDINVNDITVGRGAAGIATNTAIGISALGSNTTGYENTATGYQALYLNTGLSNTANGYQALYGNTTGKENTATGIWALHKNITGDRNTATGRQALYSNETGYENTATGERALYYNKTGFYNTATGIWALLRNITGDRNTAIGYFADVASGALSNATAIGANAIVNASNKVRIGNSSVTVIEGQVAWSNPSDKRLKENIQVNNNLGLNFINKLQPVTYNYISDNTKVRHDGFIAQDIEQIMKDLNLPFSGLKKSNDGMYSLAYSDFVMPLVNAVKEQQKTISELVGKTAELVKKNDSYESQILKLSSKLEEIEKRYSDRK